MENYQGNFQAKKATIYIQTEGIALGNIIKIEVREVEALRKQWAQYQSAVVIRFKAPRKRKWGSYIGSYKAYCIILEGWNHPNPDSPWEIVQKKEDCTLSKAKYSSGSSAWNGDFDAKIKAYLDAHPKVKVLGDYRHTQGFNPNDFDPKIPYETQQIDSVHIQLVTAGVETDLAKKAAVAYVKKSPNMSAGILNDKDQHYCTVMSGKRKFEALYLNSQIIEPEDFFS